MNRQLKIFALLLKEYICSINFYIKIVYQLQRIATEVVQKLTEKGYTAYFAGGFVRDLLLGNRSSDIDIATDALPEEIAQIFPEHALVGAQFGVCIVRHQGHQFEVATFRQDVSYEDGRRPSQVRLKSTPLEDAQRRDFTINGMFFNPLSQEILDFVEGKKDLEEKRIRTIGNPFERFEEDRLRMIRAIRFQMRFGFSLEEKTKDAINSLSHTLLPAVSMERIWQELCKIRSHDGFTEALLHMAKLGLLANILPPLKHASIDTLQQRLSGIDGVSKKVPTILIISQLFGPEDLGFLLGLAIHLKASKEDTKWIETFLEAKTLWEKDPRLTLKYEWVYLLANTKASACFEVLFTKSSSQEKEEYLQLIETFSSQFAFHIDRVHKRKPICQAKELEPLGIRPGKRMGEALRLAERLALEANLSQTEAIFDRLRQDPEWFKLLEDRHS